jgi:phosphoribosylformylglycinamidine synthase II
MSTIYRIEIFPNVHHAREMSARELSILNWANQELELSKSMHIKSVLEVNTFLVLAPQEIPSFKEMAQEVFADSVIETVYSTQEEASSKEFEQLLSLRQMIKENIWALDIQFRPGVTDNSAHAACDALKLIPALKSLDLKLSSGKFYLIETAELQKTDKKQVKDQLERLGYEKLANFLLNKVNIAPFSDDVVQSRFNNCEFPHVEIKKSESYEVDLSQSFDDLMKMNVEKCWALSADELKQIIQYFNSLKRNPTDVEIEVIAQTWSEHCKHKIFAAQIDYSEGVLPKGVKSLGKLKVDGLFKTFIRGSTLKIKEERKLPWLISIFHDNAGIVRFDDKLDLCIKVETHNSPSALDPYGGALTGILGVNRDIYGVGVGAKPIANTNVFCLAENKYFKERSFKLPKMIKNPDRIKEGVHQGVQDGGNKSGIPTVNGAFVFDRDFVGKPLVFCGTIGAIPHTENNKETSLKGQKPGHLIVMAGGRIGKDGIHGATFSSMELLDGTPASVVQIGDPITQKRLGDFLIEARKRDLFSSVTDNGAGGLSSSIGEMAQGTNGAVVYLEKALVKYPGLSPFEIMVSESQERMTFSVEPEKVEAFLNLAQARGVEASIVGEFTSSGYLEAKFHGKTVANLSLNFLHESLVPMKLKAHFDFKNKAPHWLSENFLNKNLPTNQFDKILLDLLASSNIRSQEHLVRRYDHEVKGATIVKPYTGSKDIGHMGPSDAGVIWMKPHGGGETNAIAISCGINPKVSQYDSYLMAQYALDEAVRNAVSTGANPDEMVLVDNFCWPDPIVSEKNPDGELKLAHLVRANHALHDLSIDYGMPFVSGKDSMKNDFVGKMENGETVKISVPPTLLVTAMGRVPTLKSLTTSELKGSGHFVYLIGDTFCDYQSAFELSHLYDNYKVEYPLPPLNGKKQLDLYRALHKSMREELVVSSHDLSDGGLLVALAEKMMSTHFGMKIDVSKVADESNKLLGFFFNESAGRLVVTVEEKNAKEFEDNLSGHLFYKLGETTEDGILNINGKSGNLLTVKGDELLKAFRVDAKEMDK